ncbi:uncharacterized protein METZ01_LOCUS359037 [marine metagenome]|uniref:Uncharacterized protein n=1 Tax=marine metagenome TaxID=408172 RepID=A0A382S8G8_9ZZZZ
MTQFIPKSIRIILMFTESLRMVRFLQPVSKIIHFVVYSKRTYSDS